MFKCAAGRIHDTSTGSTKACRASPSALRAGAWLASGPETACLPVSGPRPKGTRPPPCPEPKTGEGTSHEGPSVHAPWSAEGPAVPLGKLTRAF